MCTTTRHASLFSCFFVLFTTAVFFFLFVVGGGVRNSEQFSKIFKRRCAGVRYLVSRFSSQPCSLTPPGNEKKELEGSFTELSCEACVCPSWYHPPLARLGVYDLKQLSPPFYLAGVIACRNESGSPPRIKWVPTLPTLSNALCSEDMRPPTPPPPPKGALGGVRGPNQCCRSPKKPRGAQCLSESSVARLTYAMG